MLRQLVPALLLASLAVHVPTAGAVTVELEPFGKRAVAIRDLVIGGSVFDVEFVYDNYTNLLGTGAFYFFDDEAGARAAAQAINSALDTTTAEEVGPPLKPGEGFLTPNGSNYYIPYTVAPDPGYAAPLRYWTVNSGYFSPGWMDTSGPAVRAPEFVDHIPVFTVVPLPPALGLFAAGLGVLGYLGRRV
jgi:hypothetical protein